MHISTSSTFHKRKQTSIHSYDLGEMKQVLQPEVTETDLLLFSHCEK